MKKGFNRFSISKDQIFAAILVLPILLILTSLYLVVVPLQGRPFIFRSERMRGAHQSFQLMKIRTMHPSDVSEDQCALGGNILHRVTPIGAFLRKTRLDELPQIFNVLRGDIVFIGPRPPLPQHVQKNRDQFARIFEHCLPGITGLATVMLHNREERLLARCRTKDETDRVYNEHCIPMKLKLEGIYIEKRCLSLNMLILWRTFSRLGAKSLNNENSIVLKTPMAVEKLTELYKEAA